MFCRLGGLAPRPPVLLIILLNDFKAPKPPAPPGAPNPPDLGGLNLLGGLKFRLGGLKFLRGGLFLRPIGLRARRTGLLCCLGGLFLRTGLLIFLRGGLACLRGGLACLRDGLACLRGGLACLRGGLRFLIGLRFRGGEACCLLGGLLFEICLLGGLWMFLLGGLALLSGLTLIFLLGLLLLLGVFFLVYWTRLLLLPPGWGLKLGLLLLFLAFPPDSGLVKSLNLGKLPMVPMFRGGDIWRPWNRRGGEFREYLGGDLPLGGLLLRGGDRLRLRGLSLRKSRL